MSMMSKQFDLLNQSITDLSKESQLKQQLKKHFRVLKRFQSNFKNYQPQYQQQRILYSLLILQKHRKYYQDKSQASNLQKKLNSISKKVSEQSPYDQKRCISLAEKICLNIPYNQSVQNFQRQDDVYMSSLVRVVCEKKKSFFNLFPTAFTYQEKDYEAFGNFFNEKFVLLDARNQKQQKMFKNFFYDPSAIYVLKLKQNFYFLEHKNQMIKENAAKYQNQPRQNYFQSNGNQHGLNNSVKQYNLIEKEAEAPHQLIITDMKKLNVSALKEYFPQQYQVSKWNSSSDRVFIMPSHGECSVCNEKKLQFNLLNYNYAKYCDSCILNPKIRTSAIPGNLIEKFLKENQLSTKKYNLNCPQCKSKITLQNYSVSKKPKVIMCGACQKRVCLDHGFTIQQCFCYCLKCKTSTISIPTLNVNVCQDCGIKMCFKCGQKSLKLCSCICKNCLGLQNPGHQCVKRCHSCKNSLRSLKQCPKCTLPICSGCFYLALDKYDGNIQKMRCEIIDYQ